MNDESFIEILPYEVPGLIRIRKKIFNYETNVFEDRLFCSLLEENHRSAKKWLEKKYGPSSYNRGVWWTTWDRIVMEEGVYIFYMLSKSNDSA